MKFPEVRLVLYVTALVLSTILCGVAMATSPQDAPVAYTADQMRQALAQRTQALGQCNAELGPLQQLQAQVISGQVADVKAMLERFRELYEKANPGETVDADFKKAVKK